MSKLVHIALATVVAGVTLTAAAQTARADQIHFVGIHPIAAVHGDGICYIEVPHIHVYEPDHATTMYRDVDDHHHFVGDPVAYDYDGDTHAYYGHHPIAVDVVVGEPREVHYIEHCYLDGAHYHYYEPPAELSFELKGEAYWYVGTYEPEYETHRAEYVPINEVYARVTYERPVITVTPPSAYAGVVVEAPSVRVKARRGNKARKVEHHHGASAGVQISGGVEVHVPVPSVEVSFGVGGVAVGGHHHHHDHGHKHKAKKYKKHKKKYKKAKYKKHKKHKRKHNKRKHRH